MERMRKMDSSKSNPMPYKQNGRLPNPCGMITLSYNPAIFLADKF